MRHFALIPVAAWLTGCGTTVIGEGVADSGASGGGTPVATGGASTQIWTGGVADTGARQSTGGISSTILVQGGSTQFGVGGAADTGGQQAVGGVTFGGSAPAYGGMTSSSGGISTADAGGKLATGGVSGTAIAIAGCGDGILNPTEQCDDGNQMSNDGCSTICQVEPGWQCRTAGHYCVPICGDSVMVGNEGCDDGNKDAGDGCSSTCLTEPGYFCNGTGPASCKPTVCGDGKKDNDEACDCGTDTKNLPIGCAGPNGFFFGDGSGCSRMCTQEPICARNDTAGCASVCGDGNVSGNEKCDDGNTHDGDGCKGDCSATEDGFMCEQKTVSAAEDCPSDPSLKCLVAPVIYRDFEGQNVTGGHPDFFYMGAAATGGRTVGVTPGATKTTCVPNAFGTPLAFTDGAQCPASDQSGPCTGLVAANLDAVGKPVMAKQKCHCVFTDWDNTGILGTCSGATCTTSGISGVGTCGVAGTGDHHLRIEADVDMFQSATSFNQWYRDSEFSKKVLGMLELAATNGGHYQFSSSRPGDPAGSPSRSRYDDLHSACLATPHNATLNSGFFPLEDQPSTKICNLSSYWMTGIASATDATCCAGTGCPVNAQFDPRASDNCPMEGTGGLVPSSDGTGGKLTGIKRNFYFTSEVRYLFRYDGQPATLSVNGDDDIWVFINGILAADLGGTHERAAKEVNISPSIYKLMPGGTYEIVVFQAKRSPVESNYQLTLSSFSTLRTECAALCGDGTVAGGEECDLGAGKNTGAYDGCNADCTYAGFCGDGIVNGPEQCDDGLNLSMTYDPNHPGACHPGCTLTPG